MAIGYGSITDRLKLIFLDPLRDLLQLGRHDAPVADMAIASTHTQLTAASIYTGWSGEAGLRAGISVTHLEPKTGGKYS